MVVPIELIDYVGVDCGTMMSLTGLNRKRSSYRQLKRSSVIPII
jgi:hypothetical protein